MLLSNAISWETPSMWGVPEVGALMTSRTDRETEVVSSGQKCDMKESDKSAKSLSPLPPELSQPELSEASKIMKPKNCKVR
ncbi:hypothetical protein EYF80_028983 [Liparis tanakae]|uniref:Uncharacterized protein n=1 Tax=Liparis tanakae TaxID=230148 RepID=A0A4Z2H714_9TELE|nr:hypothetical protein EYF80_028983 [Liparis tanakae]